jgi:hypothetical protein
LGKIYGRGLLDRGGMGPIPGFAFPGRKSFRSAAAPVAAPGGEPVAAPVGEPRGGAGEAAVGQARGSTENPSGCRWRRRGGRHERLLHGGHRAGPELRLRSGQGQAKGRPAPGPSGGKWGWCTPAARVGTMVKGKSKAQDPGLGARGGC